MTKQYIVGSALLHRVMHGRYSSVVCMCNAAFTPAQLVARNTQLVARNKHQVARSLLRATCCAGVNAA